MLHTKASFRCLAAPSAPFVPWVNLFITNYSLKEELPPPSGVNGLIGSKAGKEKVAFLQAPRTQMAGTISRSTRGWEGVKTLLT